MQGGKRLCTVNITNQDLKKLVHVLGYEDGTGHDMRHSGVRFKDPSIWWRHHNWCFEYPTREGFGDAIDSVYRKLQKHLASMLMGDVNRKYRVEFRIVYGFPEAVLERFFFLLERDKWAFLEKFLAIYGIERNRVKATVRRDVSEERSDVVVE